MKITVFTSNQPRHLSLVSNLCKIASEVYVVQECNTLFPGQVQDFFKKSEIMQDYFSRVIEAERIVFGAHTFSPANARILSMKMRDINKLSLETLQPALQSDVYVVFGASYIKGELIDFLVRNRALNIHMGVSPYYRGSSCNFWALYDKNIPLLGATIHLLSKGLDSGSMLFHALPKSEEVDGFLLGMRSVQSAHSALVSVIANGDIEKFEPIKQDKEKEVRYTRNAEFTDDVAMNYLKNLPTPQQIKYALDNRDMSQYYNPFIG